MLLFLAVKGILHSPRISIVVSYIIPVHYTKVPKNKAFVIVIFHEIEFILIYKKNTNKAHFGDCLNICLKLEFRIWEFMKPYLQREKNKY